MYGGIGWPSSIFHNADAVLDICYKLYTLRNKKNVSMFFANRCFFPVPDAIKIQK